jgi:Spy/CpxP family protein refolding chaperone
MKMRLPTWSFIVLLSCLCTMAPAAPAGEAPAPADVEAQYTKDLNKRADDALAELKLDDAAKADRVRELIIAQYRVLRAQHDARDAKLKDIPKDDKDAIAKVKADTDAAIKPLHDSFLEKLAADLTPEQIEIVKDRMTMGKVKNDYNAFCDQFPDLTEAQKAYILAQLKEAREIAMDQGSAKEKHDVFGKYRGRINNYLVKEGYDLKKASKEWAERRKNREAQAKQAAVTQPAN